MHQFIIRRKIGRDVPCVEFRPLFVPLKFLSVPNATEILYDLLELVADWHSVPGTQVHNYGLASS